MRQSAADLSAADKGNFLARHGKSFPKNRALPSGRGQRKQGGIKRGGGTSAWRSVTAALRRPCDNREIRNRRKRKSRAQRTRLFFNLKRKRL
jgi:hypothetical protein